MEEIKIITFFVEEFSKDSIGGVKSYLRRISSALMSEGRDVIILTQLSKNNSRKQEIIEGIEVHRLDCGDLIDRIREFSLLTEEEKEQQADYFFTENELIDTALKLAGALELFIKKNQPRAIHVHNSFFLFPYALYFLTQKDSLRLPSIYFWCHSPTKALILPGGDENNLYSALASFQNLFTRIFSVSKAVHQELLKAGINSKVHYIGINTDQFIKRKEKASSLADCLNIPPESFVILYTGRFLKVKGLDLFPEILHRLINREKGFTNSCFLLVGKGVYQKKLQEKINEMELEEQFFFATAKSTDELIDYYSLADCFVLASRREAIGLSLLEAMSCSLPCVASDLPGIREAIEHGKNGLLAPISQVEEFVRWLAIIKTNESLRKKLGEEARKTIQYKFNEEDHLKYFLRKLVR
ncbi:MAG: glycosyltransferase [Candidatus Heimdallarchaeota archaeon]|nr:glycosyltransferase [Candidatus Heimdallarchaeota archaeon]